MFIQKTTQYSPFIDRISLLCLLSAADTHNLTETTSGLSVLTTDLKVPVVTETTVSTIMNKQFHFLPHLLQTVEILTKSSLNTVGDNMLVLASLEVLLSVEEPLRNVVLKRTVDHSNELLNLFIGKFTGTTQ